MDASNFKDLLKNIASFHCRGFMLVHMRYHSPGCISSWFTWLNSIFWLSGMTSLSIFLIHYHLCPKEVKKTNISFGGFVCVWFLVVVVVCVCVVFLFPFNFYYPFSEWNENICGKSDQWTHVKKQLAAKQWILGSDFLPELSVKEVKEDYSKLMNLKQPLNVMKS